ncbi:ABC transporter ATP-binding protein [Lacrimispora sp.]|uniref:ABC transporter ATP-binding protein n=1 Tax=Lacrimispora sp. TaxID=2719234 RepID=UPI0028AE81E5|nr:ABC transporter ATP-binding protein [Lacrimispora sp.]
MSNILEINDVSKSYQNFMLQNVSFALPEGCIMGLIGINGSGKTTLINSVLNLIRIDQGDIKIFGMEHDNLATDAKEKLGVVYDENCLPEGLSIKQICNVFCRIYKSWDEKLYYSMIEKMEIPSSVSIGKMSRGNKIKVNLVVALAHHPRLLILDEITASLDPIMRNNIIALFREFVQDEKNSILFSSHITTDLETVADYITFIDNGKLIFSMDKDSLLDDNLLIRCKESEFARLDKAFITAYENKPNGVIALASNQLKQYCLDELINFEEPTIEEIMLLITKGVR